METKICSVCKKSMPATLEYFHAQSRGKYGVRGWCKKCNKEKRKVYASADKAKARHAELERIRRKKKYEQDPNYYKKIYVRDGAKQNQVRKEKYLSDPEYRNKKLEAEKRYKESGRRYEVGSAPDQREKSRIRRKKNYHSNVELEHQKGAIWRANNPEYGKIKSKERSVNLQDSYIFHQIKGKSKLQLKLEDIPKEVLDVKRNMILLKREIGIKGNQKF